MQTETILNVSALMGVPSGSTDTFREPSQTNTCTDVSDYQQRILRYVTAANGHVTYNRLLPRNV